MPGVEIEFVQLLQDMLGDLEGNPEPIEVKVFGDDLPTLLARSPRPLEEKLRKVDGLVDLVGPRLGNPELQVQIDPTRAARAGFTPEQITDAVVRPGCSATSRRRCGAAIGSSICACGIPTRTGSIPPGSTNFPLTTAAGIVVPLQATADVRSLEGSAQLYREDLKQMVPITGRLEGRDIGSVMQDVKTVLDAGAVAGRLHVSDRRAVRNAAGIRSASLLVVAGGGAAAGVRPAGRAVPPLHGGTRDHVGGAAVAGRRVRAAAGSPARR